MPDGRYLVTRKVHWQAVYRVLVDEGWYDASLGYAAFVEYIRSVAPPGGFRIMPDVETIRHISQTLYARPFAKWRYDAAYHTKRWAYERMRAVAEALLGVMGEENSFFFAEVNFFVNFVPTKCPPKLGGCQRGVKALVATTADLSAQRSPFSGGGLLIPNQRDG